MLARLKLDEFLFSSGQQLVVCLLMGQVFAFILIYVFIQERAKAAEEHKRNIMEYRAFLESCDFIKVFFEIIHTVVKQYEAILVLLWKPDFLCASLLGKHPMEKSSRSAGG